MVFSQDESSQDESISPISIDQIDQTPSPLSIDQIDQKPSPSVSSETTTETTTEIATDTNYNKETISNSWSYLDSWSLILETQNNWINDNTWEDTSSHNSGTNEIITLIQDTNTITKDNQKEDSDTESKNTTHTILIQGHNMMKAFIDSDTLINTVSPENYIVWFYDTKKSHTQWQESYITQWTYYEWTYNNNIESNQHQEWLYQEWNTIYESEEDDDSEEEDTTYINDPSFIEFWFWEQGKHLIFSKPVQIQVPVMIDGNYQILVQHEWDSYYNEFGLSIDPNTNCNEDWSTTLPSNNINSIWWVVTFYTCGASTFILNPNGTWANDAVVWFKGDAGTSTTTHGAAVLTWTDQVAWAVYTKTAWGTPFYYDSTWLNRNPVLTWNNTREFLRNVWSAGAHNNWTVFTVIKSNTLSNSSDLIWNTSTRIRNEQQINTARWWFSRVWIHYTSTINHAFTTFELMTIDHINTSTNVNFETHQAGTMLTNALNVWASIAPLTPDRVWLSFNGYYAEVIMHNYVLSTNEKQKVRTYLATKYWLTLAHNYLDTSWTLVYNISSYPYDIAWIGRDDASTLYQKQSKSINNTWNITVSLGAIATSNQTNSSTISTNKSYTLIGHDNGSMAWTTEWEYEHTTRERKVMETWSIGSVRITVSSGMFNSRSGDLYLLVDTDGNFSNATGYVMTSWSNGTRYIDFDFSWWTSYIAFGRKKGGNICIESPVLFTTWIIAQNSNQIIEYQFDYFKVNDGKWSNTWYYTTVSISALTGTYGNTISNSAIERKADPITTLSGSTNTWVLLWTWMNTYHPATNVDTFIYRNNWINNGLQWVYWSKLRIKITIPAYTRIGVYTGTLTYTLYEN